MASKVSLYVLGVSGSGANYAKGFWHTSFVLLVDGRSYIVDCPRNLQPMLAYNRGHGDMPVSLSDYRDVILTHLHFDHAEGLVELANEGVVPANQSIDLHAPASTLEYLWSQADKYGVVSARQVNDGNPALDRCFRPHALANPEEFEGFRLHYRPTQHIPNTFAYVFDFGGYRLGYSADTAFDPALIAWLDTCDIVLHEVLWLPWSEVEAVRRIHTPLEDLLALPEAFQRKTLLCHYDDETYLEQEIGSYRFLRQNVLYELVT